MRRHRLHTVATATPRAPRLSIGKPPPPVTLQEVSTETSVGAIIEAGANPSAGRTAFRVLAAISFCHLLNDMLQSVIPAVYPILKSAYRLDFGQIGLITLTSQLTASLLQPLVGLYTDHRPTPYSLPVGMTFTMIGLVLLSFAPTFGVILLAVALVGMGSSVFHPESSRVARMASGGQHGLAQSVFQVGGNAGSALGPLLAAYLVAPHGQRSILWCALVAVAGIIVTFRIGRWQRARHRQAA